MSGGGLTIRSDEYKRSIRRRFFLYVYPIGPLVPGLIHVLVVLRPVGPWLGIDGGMSGCTMQ